MSNVIDTSTIGGRIKKLRTDAGLTQEELAEKLNLEGKSAISNYENNSRGVSTQLINQLSGIFYISTDYLLNGETEDCNDPFISEATSILNDLKTTEAKNAAVEILKQIHKLDK